MENNLDKLFKDKLSLHEEIPSLKAWDQIQDQLAANKKKVWGRRLAIAASILLFASLGYFGFYSIDSISLDGAKTVTKSTKEQNFDNASVQAIEHHDTVKSHEKSMENGVIMESKTNPGKILAQTTAAKAQKQNKPIEVALTSKVEENPVETNKEEVEIPVAGIILEESLNKETIAHASSTETEMAPDENHQISSEVSNKEKYFPQVKITYKASNQSALVGKGKKSIR